MNLTTSKVPSRNHSSEFLRMPREKGEAKIQIFPNFGRACDSSMMVKFSPPVVWWYCRGMILSCQEVGRLPSGPLSAFLFLYTCLARLAAFGRRAMPEDVVGEARTLPCTIDLF